MSMKSLAATSVAVLLTAPFAANADKPVPVTVVNPVVPVELANADAIRVVETSSGTPFQIELCQKIPVGTCTRNLEEIPHRFDVPGDKRLVIEFVSATCGLSPTPNFLYRLELRTTAGSVTLDHQLPGINPAFMVAQQTRIYADPGSTVDFSNILRQTSGDALCYMSLSGELVDP